MLRKPLILSVCLAASLNAGMFGDLAGAVIGGGSGAGASLTNALTGSSAASAASAQNAAASASKNSAAAPDANDVDAIVATFQQAESGLNNSVDLINNALADKKQLDEWKEKEKTINAMPDSSEKDAEMKKLNEDQLAYATKMAESKDTQTKMKKLSAQQKTKVGKSVTNLYLVALKDSDALAKAKTLVSTMTSNPFTALKFAMDIPKLKDVITTVPTQLTSLATLTKGYAGMAKSSGIAVAQPKSADEPLKEVEI